MEGIKLDGIRDGKGKPEGIFALLASALSGEARARRELEKSLTLRAEATALNRIWQEYLDEHTRHSSRLATALEWVGNIKQRLANSETSLANDIGRTMAMTEDQAIARSQELASASAGLPFLEKAIEKVRAELRAHVAQMRKWGSKNGVPKDTLAAIQG
jgi:hypothetical protein